MFISIYEAAVGRRYTPVIMKSLMLNALIR